MRAPFLAGLFLVIAMANLAIPGSANFIGEFYILNGAFQSKIVLACIAAIGIALAAFYSPPPLPADHAQPSPRPAPSRARFPCATASSWPRWSRISSRSRSTRVILERGKDSVAEPVNAVQAADDDEAVVERRGRTGFGPVAER